jgi:hypothetical protein
MRWGTKAHAGDAANPGFMHDIFARVGGPAPSGCYDKMSQAMVMVIINSGHVVGDNLWLWRADHTATGLVYNGDNPCMNALIVNGDDVTMYGLKAEHTLMDLVKWNGDRGRTYFFQSEFPYDVNQDYGDSGYVGYRVDSKVKEHHTWGIGVYHYFRDFPVVLQTTMACPPHLEKNFFQPVAVFLNGKGKALHVLNDKGNVTARFPNMSAVPSWICSEDPPVEETVDFPTARRSAANESSSSALPKCKVGERTRCPGSGFPCHGNKCCPDGSTCPSAEDDFMCCPQPKIQDCLKPDSTPGPITPPLPLAACRIGDIVKCPGSSDMCKGDQCCPDMAACPSANVDFKGCPHGKRYDCVGAMATKESEIVV